MKLISDKCRAECEAIRATYAPQDPVWTETESGGVRADFGDYVAWAHEVTPPGIYWEVGKKIVNELFGPGRMHVIYGYDGETIENAKRLATEAVARDRKQRGK